MELDALPVSVAGYVALAGAAGSAYMTWRNFVTSRVKSDERAEIVNDALKSCELSIASIQLDLASHKLDVARHYVAIESLEKVETRIFAAIDGVTSAIRDLGTRLDRAFEQRPK